MGLDINKDCFSSSMVLSSSIECSECVDNAACNEAITQKQRLHREKSKEKAKKELKDSESSSSLKKRSITYKEVVEPSDEDICADDIVIKSGDKEWLYSFPEIGRISPKRSTKKLYEILEKLIKKDDYLAVRDAYCSIQIELNRRFCIEQDGIQSPRFRPKIMLPPSFSKKEIGKAYSFLSNDTQVIAMDWHKRRGRQEADDELADKAYSGKEFDYWAASEFVVKRGYASVKVEIIGLDVDERWETGSFDDKVMFQQWKVIKAVVKKGKRELQQLSRRNHQISNSVNEWSDLLMALLIEGVCVKSESDISPLQIANRYQLITGKPMSRQSARSKINSIKKHLSDYNLMP